MEPRIQYAKTSDGVSIAFRVLGKGMPFVQTLALGSDLRLHWEIPEVRTWYEHLAEKRMLVQYDNRGTGLSQRDVTGFSLEALGCDIEAVADRLGLERFALWGTQNMGPVAIAYAARHPERVSHLILWCSYARASDMLKSPQSQALARLIDNWELFTDTAAHYNWGWSGGEAARLLAVRMREGVTQETYWALLGQLLTADVADLLPTIRAPTLVLHRRRFPQVSVDVATDLASRIPNAQLVLLEGESGNFTLENGQAVLDAINDFLGEGEEAAVGAEPAAGAMVTILFTDMEGSTTLTQRVGDAAAQEVLRTHNGIVRDALKAHNGTEIKHTGDGIMASFASATRALECAIAMQRAFAAYNRGVGAALAPPQGAASDAPTAPTPTEPLHIRIGLNAGEPIAEEDPDGRRDLFGTAVQLAARICAHAEPGQILAPVVVRELAAGKRFLFADQGEATLRGFEDPVRLYEVRWREA
ncbi:MAG: adenylate/guanylate cyclase domain-containing protein [Dehalococcoidia bacterium]